MADHFAESSIDDFHEVSFFTEDKAFGLCHGEILMRRRI
jgi:hypothetical protein